jgi:hypothetical protein
MIAIAMPQVTMRTDEEQGAAIGRHAELLVEGEAVGGRHPEISEDRWTEAPGDGNIASLLGVLPRPRGD